MKRLTLTDIAWVSVHNLVNCNYTYMVCVRDGYTTHLRKFTSGSPYRECTRVPKCVRQFIALGRVAEEGLTYKKYETA